MTALHLWDDHRLSCVVAVSGEPVTYALWLIDGSDLLRERTHYTMEAAVAEAGEWRAQTQAATLAAMNRSTPY